jgi:hypothetical protein
LAAAVYKLFPLPPPLLTFYNVTTQAVRGRGGSGGGGGDGAKTFISLSLSLSLSSPTSKEMKNSPFLN